MRLPITLTGSADELPLRPLARIAGSAEITGGTLTMRLDARGPARTPAGELKLRLDDLAGRRFPATDATVELSADAQEGPHLVARVTRRGQTLATVDASVRVATAQFDDLAAVAAAPLSVRAHVGPMRVQREGLPPVRERDKTRTMSGLVEADLRLEGTLRAPILAMSATAQDARLDDRPLGRAELVVRYQDARPTVAINAITTAGGALRLTGSAALDLGYPRVLRPIDLRGVPVSIDLESKQLELAAFSGIAAPIRALGGRLTANARLRGKVGAPQVDGRIEWKDGRLVVAELGAYDGIHLLVHGNGQEVVLDELTARAGQGRARLTARADRAGAEGFRVTTDVRLSKFPLYAEGQPLAALSLEASAAGTVSAERIDLSTRVTEAHVFLAEGKRKKLQELKRPPDIVLLDHGKPLNREQARKQRHLATQSPVLPPPEASGPARVGRRVRLAVEAPRNLWIEGPDVHLELGLAEGFVVTVNDEPRVFGTLVVKRGRLELLGRRFDVDGESSVRFTGPPDRPTLAIKATHQSRKAGIGVRVALDGPLDKLEMKLSSPDNPQLGDTELLAVLATGHLPDERSGSTASPGAQAVSVLGGALASQIQKSLSKRLPIDVLVIEPGEGLSGTRLEAGTYLSDALYVAYVGRVGADPFGRENRNEIQLEYQLTRRWSFQGAYGDARRGSADLVWTKNY